MPTEKHIKTPEEMWELFEKYKTHVKSSPIKVKDWVGKDAEPVNREKERPLSFDGFEIFIDMDLVHYSANTHGSYSDFIEVMKKIRKAIRTDQIEGGMAGIFNANITQRLNGLVEKTDNTNRNIEQPFFPEKPANVHSDDSDK